MRDPVEFLTTGAFWPSVIQQESRGERVYDLPSRLLRERIIFITGPIDDNVAASKSWPVSTISAPSAFIRATFRGLAVVAAKRVSGSPRLRQA